MNRRRGEVAIEIGGEERVLRFTNNAVASIEESLETSILALIQRPQLRFVREAICQGLRYEDRKITPAQVGRMLDDEQSQDLTYYAVKVVEGIVNALKLDGAEDEGKAEDTDPPKAASIG